MGNDNGWRPEWRVLGGDQGKDGMRALGKRRIYIDLHRRPDHTDPIDGTDGEEEESKGDMYLEVQKER